MSGWRLVSENGAVLPPSGATPAVLLGVVKKFLIEMDEPLLTYKYSMAWNRSRYESSGDLDWSMIGLNRESILRQRRM